MKAKTLLIILFVVIAIAVIVLFFVKKKQSAAANTVIVKSNASNQNAATTTTQNNNSSSSTSQSGYPIVYNKFSEDAKLLQGALGVTQDGVIGKNTLAAWQKYDSTVTSNFQINSKEELNSVIDSIVGGSSDQIDADLNNMLASVPNQSNNSFWNFSVFGIPNY